MAPKFTVIVGITGNQGGSVANTFLSDPAYRIRGISRNPSSAAAKKLAEQGVEIVKADLDDPESLEKAFEGANLIFSVTNYWEPFFRPDCRALAKEKGMSCREFAYEVEYRQGKNIADAAAKVVSSLDNNGFIASTLSHAGKCSKGKYKDLYHFDAKADIFPDYVNKTHPALAKKSSYIQTGYFTSSYKLAPNSYFKKLPSGTYETSFPTPPHTPVPHLSVRTSTGPFVSAVSRMPPGHAYMCEGTTCSWSEYMAHWSEVTGKEGRYRQCSLREFVEANHEDEMFGVEAGVMFEYSGEVGYDGGDEGLVRKEDLWGRGLRFEMVGLREWMEGEDWGSVLGR
ncbi:NAD(P)-binding protein [Mollisia scopiformis]|uniref:NAD(P)-binding protein n=1 Tax=Mollisia scopiformis TaxID=149040 RepID=A0A132BC44_MOLSC|nr:NAD(P)-binding protein [Mollisia scopiformis]KUJ09956.1 NAD(P)-binding protein [Mollisia scopiformis]